MPNRSLVDNFTSDVVGVNRDADSVDGSGETIYDDEEQTGNPFILPWYFRVGYVVAFTAMVLVAAGGNTGVVWIVVTHRRMRTVTNYFLVNLAVADALMSILNTMFNFIYMLYSDWPFGRAYCKFTVFIAPCTIAASVFTFIAIAFDRYLAIVYPLKPRQSSFRVLLIIFFIWIVSIGLSSPNLVYATTHTWRYNKSDPESSRTVCYIDWPDGANSTTDFIYSILLMVLTYFVPLAVLGRIYVVIGCQLWGSQAIGERTDIQIATINTKRRIVRMLIVVVVIFAVCWLPQHVLLLVSSHNEEITRQPYIQHVYLAIYWLAMSNSMYNPIIYCLMNARFRAGFCIVFRCLLPCLRLCDSRQSSSTQNGLAARTGLTEFHSERGRTGGELTVNGRLRHNPYLDSSATAKRRLQLDLIQQQQHIRRGNHSDGGKPTGFSGCVTAVGCSTIGSSISSAAGDRSIKYTFNNRHQATLPICSIALTTLPGDDVAKI